MTPAVETHGVAKQYGSLVALDNLTITVEPGEVLGVLGPNGAGKTTAMRVLTTILSPTPWQLRGRRHPAHAADGDPPADRRPSGERRLSGAADGRGVPALPRAALRPLAGERPRRRPGAARRGRPRRTPQVADRDVQPRHAPAAGHRPRARQRPPRRLPRRADARPRPGRPATGPGERPPDREPSAGRAVLLSTHLLAEVEENCSRVLILNRGHVVAAGTVAEVARRAAAPRSARLHVAAGARGARGRGAHGDVGVEDVERADGQPGLAERRLLRRPRRATGTMQRRGSRPARRGRRAPRVRARRRAPLRRLPGDDRGRLTWRRS